ncbi:universal stress protein [Mucilaginibacter sp. OK098]|uniref:universal stress protein n=1 Tax=Mucilaginibacter sp. OK098 TaxID=1855297 RepID=UPI00092100D0|nr:universal stress protein [Mucilaginibacter sp. OK098]SHN14114.1 Nucleotide-binding universal stress protein, UspA family [Mucilaginibacter sp. OK098]
MKTILVLTDFSINASYTAQYALELAQQAEANLLLSNIYERPSDEQIADTKQWAMGNTEANSIDDLGVLLSELKNALDKDVNRNKFRPDIEQCSKEGLIADKLNDIAADREILMAVISTHTAGLLSTLLSGNHAGKIIDNAKFPILLVPYQVRFQSYKTIAFATAMNNSDIGVLQSLSGLAGYSGSDILIAHVDPGKTENEHTVEQFFNQVSFKINYPKILYRNIQNSSVIDSLKLLMKKVDIDLLVLVHHKAGFFSKLLKRSVVQKLALCATKPLLIFPCATALKALPVF